jgi:hypothetical protein
MNPYNELTISTASNQREESTNDTIQNIAAKQNGNTKQTEINTTTIDQTMNNYVELISKQTENNVATIDQTMNNYEELISSNNNNKHHEQSSQYNNLSVTNNYNFENPTIQTTSILFSTNSAPSRSRPVLNPPKGDCFKVKQPGDLRFLNQNANSLQPHSMAKWEGTLDRLKHLNVDVTGLCETCVNFGNDDIMKKFKNTIYKRTPGGSITTSIVDTNYKKPYLPGGTLTLVTGT